MRPFDREGGGAAAAHDAHANAAADRDGDSDSSEAVSADDKVPWIAVDPSQPDLDQARVHDLVAACWRVAHVSDPQFPLFQHALPLLRIAEVGAGDVLYLPSLWLHHVEQQRAADGRPCIALNWW